MTNAELRRILTVRGRVFTLPLYEIKERAGEPANIVIVSRWCSKTGRDLVVLTYLTDDGISEIHGLMGFLNGQQALFDAWVTLTPLDEVGNADRGTSQRLWGATGTQICFDGWGGMNS